MTIEESNKLIAEFTGSKENQRSEFDLFGTADLIEIFQEIEADDLDAKHFFTPEEMEFHKNWNWLMPVVRKIIDICIEDDDHFLSDEYTSLLETIPLANIEDSYKIVIEFIQYYNRQER
jgi:hypothetical protein